MQPFSGNQRPDLLTAPMKMSLVLRLPRKMHLCRSSSNVPRLPSFLEMLQNPHVLRTFDAVHNPLRLPRETTSERQKKVRACCVFNMFTSKCASRHNGVHFFDISTSKSGPNLVCFVHFDFKMCFAPQRRALFDSAAAKKCSEPVSFFSLLAWKCASRHNGVQVFISHLASWLRTRRFSTLRSHKSFEKHTVLRLSYLFAHLDLLSSEAFSFLIFFLLLFSDSSHLCFLSVHIVGSLTSKLPSVSGICQLIEKQNSCR